uniref:Uncharacterized protein n=1 Tax=Anguilla anguilla TaxID=7936 RepID=A0A0E9UDT0_ANGAN
MCFNSGRSTIYYIQLVSIIH